MFNGQSVLAVIPARGGSKRFPGKNLALFLDKPLLQWAIESARGSKYIDRVVISTEDAKISTIAEMLGAEVLRRPEELATDTASSEDVVRHALVGFPQFRVVVLLQPTSPLRTSGDIDKCVELLELGGAVVSVWPDGKNNGAVYVWDAEKLKLPVKYIMPADRCLDIDYESQMQ